MADVVATMGRVPTIADSDSDVSASDASADDLDDINADGGDGVQPKVSLPSTTDLSLTLRDTMDPGRRRPKPGPARPGRCLRRRKDGASGWHKCHH